MAISINLYPGETLTLIATFYSRLQQQIILTGQNTGEEFSKASPDNKPGVFNVSNTTETEVIIYLLKAYFLPEAQPEWQESRQKIFYNSWMGSKAGFDDAVAGSDFDDMSVFIKVDNLNFPMRLVHAVQPHLFVSEEEPANAYS